MTYYECHVTLLGDPVKIRPIVESIKWKFSCIDGDPTFGDGVKCYATRHFNARCHPQDLISTVRNIADYLKNSGIEVIRRKVEKVIFDDRSTKTQCSGGCVECHLDDLQPIP